MGYAIFVSFVAWKWRMCCDTMEVKWSDLKLYNKLKYIFLPQETSCLEQAGLQDKENVYKA